MKSFCLFMMGGSGLRFGAEIPKQFNEINEKPLFVHILKKINNISILDGIVVVTNSDFLEMTKQWIKTEKLEKVFSVVNGGDTRSRSVYNGVMEVGKYASENDAILLHDATAPYVWDIGYKMVIDGIKEYGAATLDTKICNTAYKKNSENIITGTFPRDQIAIGLSPEGMRYKIIYDLYKNATPDELETMTSAGALALKYNIPFKTYTTDFLNLKITVKQDFELLKLLFNNYFFVEDAKDE